MTSEETSATASEHPLQTKWCWWYFDRYNRVDNVSAQEEAEAEAETEAQDNASGKEEERNGREYAAPPQRCESEPYSALWTKLGSFDTIEQFVHTYAHVTRPSAIKIANLSLFRGDETPTWESYPRGGQWIVEMRKNGDLLDRLWEQLIISVICEEFEQPDLVGVSLSIRPKVDFLSIWQKDAGNTRVKNAIVDKMKSILHLGPQVTVRYKSNKQALSDGRSFVYAKTYVVGESGNRSRRNSIAGRSRRNSTADRSRRNSTAERRRGNSKAPMLKKKSSKGENVAPGKEANEAAVPEQKETPQQEIVAN